MILEQNYITPLLPVEKSNMSDYPNTLTPPSSSEDSFHPVYFHASPNSTTFQAPENYDMAQVPTFEILQPMETMMIDPSMILESRPKDAYLKFVEEPTDKFRFRYKSEMAGTHGSLTGMNSDKARKQTYPTVELRNCTEGTAIIRCSIYQLNSQGNDFMPHAHRLIMKKGKDELDDPHDLVVGREDSWRATFHGMGIIHTAKKNIISELIRKKTQLKMEYVARMEHKPRELMTSEKVQITELAQGESKSINLNIVCLRFDAFVKKNDILYPICEPIYSHGINNLKSALTGELKIVRLDHYTSPAKGGKEVFILVERVTKKNIKIRFFELDSRGEEVWSDYGKFNDLDVHHQYAIVFKTPKYRDENITEKVKVYIELIRPTDDARSEPREFTFIPSKSYTPGSKRPRTEYSSSSYNSSNLGSDELPSVINNLNLEQPPDLKIGNSWNEHNLLTSTELETAVNNVDSDEFKKLFSQFGQEYSSCLSNVVDAPLINVQDPTIQNKTDYEVAEFQMGPKVVSSGYHLAFWQGQKYPRGQMCEDVTIKNIQSYSKSLARKVQNSAIKIEISPDDLQMAWREYEEIKSFVKASHKSSDAPIKFINHHLNKDGENRTNALHVFVCQNNTEEVKYLLKLIHQYKQFDLVNVKNKNSQTALQLAVRCHNKVLVPYLLLSQARVSATDGKLNTALHTAVEENVSKEIIDCLLSNRPHEKVKEYIDSTNVDGNTAVMMVIEKKNLEALKLLHAKGADINKRNMKSGYTPLRFAVEKQNLDIIKYILSLSDMDPTVGDFNDVSPLAAAHRQESSKEIMDVIEKYMIEKNVEIDIKEEQEEESDEEMEDEADVKLEPIPMEELEDLYKKVKNFVPQCLDHIADILTDSGNWEHLADLLDVSSFIRCGIITTDPSISKNLLTFAIETHNDTLWEIRNFLESLDEFRAVEIMDKMVRDSQ